MLCPALLWVNDSMARQTFVWPSCFGSERRSPAANASGGYVILRMDVRMNYCFARSTDRRP